MLCQSSLFPLPGQLCFSISGIVGTLPVNFHKFGRKPLLFQSDLLTPSSIPIIFNLTSWPPSPQSLQIWFSKKLTEHLAFFSETSSAFWTACGRLRWNIPGQQQQQQTNALQPHLCNLPQKECGKTEALTLSFLPGSPPLDTRKLTTGISWDSVAHMIGVQPPSSCNRFIQFRSVQVNTLQLNSVQLAEFSDGAFYMF